MQEFGFNTVDKSNFQLTGIQLCALSREDFLKQAPPYTGDVLYSHLNLLKAKGVRGDKCWKKWVFFTSYCEGGCAKELSLITCMKG